MLIAHKLRAWLGGRRFRTLGMDSFPYFDSSCENNSQAILSRRNGINPVGNRSSLRFLLLAGALSLPAQLSYLQITSEMYTFIFSGLVSLSRIPFQRLCHFFYSPALLLGSRYVSFESFLFSAGSLSFFPLSARLSLASSQRALRQQP